MYKRQEEGLQAEESDSQTDKSDEDADSEGADTETVASEDESTDSDEEMCIRDRDNIRELRESVKYPPASGRKKVYIIDEVHMLSQGAFNALLKTLEEPPEYVVFILCLLYTSAATAIGVALNVPEGCTFSISSFLPHIIEREKPPAIAFPNTARSGVTPKYC